MTASTCQNVGLDTRFLDYSPYAREFFRIKTSGANPAFFLDGLQKRLLFEIEAAKPDLLLGIAQAPLYDVQMLDRLKKSGMLTAFWFVEDYRVLTYWKDIASHFAAFFTIQTGPFFNELDRIETSSHYYLPVAFDKNFKEGPVGGFFPSDVSFMGAPYPNRVELFRRLAPELSLKIYGEGWSAYAATGVVLGDRRVTESEAR